MFWDFTRRELKEEGYSRRVRKRKDSFSEDLKKKLSMFDPEVLALHISVHYQASA
jgi:hypothetical protein